jgi:simple sugar transport system ATP-binding protein
MTEPIIQIRGLVNAFGSQVVHDGLDLDVRAGEVIGLARLLGSGRTETADVLFGRTAADQGEGTDKNGKLNLATPRTAIAEGFGYAPEDRKTDGIVAELSVRENIALALQARRGWANPIPQAEQKKLADDYIRKLDIRTSSAEKAVGDLSGGNQQKVVLARWLAMNPRFLILDEPTRGIDVGAHAEILKLIGELTDQGMSILLISSEFDELIAASDRVIVVRDHRHVSQLVGEDIDTDRIINAIASRDESERATS